MARKLDFLLKFQLFYKRGQQFGSAPVASPPIVSYPRKKNGTYDELAPTHSGELPFGRCLSANCRHFVCKLCASNWCPLGYSHSRISPSSWSRHSCSVTAFSVYTRLFFIDFQWVLNLTSYDCSTDSWRISKVSKVTGFPKPNRFLRWKYFALNCLLVPWMFLNFNVMA